MIVVFIVSVNGLSKIWLKQPARWTSMKLDVSSIVNEKKALIFQPQGLTSIRLLTEEPISAMFCTANGTKMVSDLLKASTSPMVVKTRYACISPPDPDNTM